MTSLIVFLYRVALYLLPGGFRARYGKAMVDEARLGLEDAVQEGRPSHVLAVSRLTADFLGTWLREWGAVAAEWLGGRQPGLLADARLALRSLRRTPAFTTTVLITLGLGIGASAALFSGVDAVVLRRLPVPDPERLVLLRWSASTPEMAGSVDDRPVIDPVSGARTSRSFSTLAYQRFRDSASGLSSTFAFARLEQLNVVAAGEAEIASGQLVSGGYHDGLGVEMAIGRGIRPGDDAPGADPVAVLSHGYWDRRFGRDTDVLGRTVELNGVAFTVVGVTAAAFSGTLEVGESPDFSVPLALEVALRPGDSNLHEPWNWWLFVMGRMEDGVRSEAVGSALEGLFQVTAQEGWDAMPDEVRSLPEFQGTRALPRLEVVSGSRGLDGARAIYARRLRTLGIMVLGILLVACTNVAGLLLVRTEARHREIAVRRALGAGRVHIARQLGVEGLVLALLGALVGIVIAYWGKDGLIAWLPSAGRDLALRARLDGRLLAFAATVAVFVGVTIGALPALTATSKRRSTALRAAGGMAPSTRGTLRRAMTVTQVALAFVLLTLAGLFVGTVRSLQQVELGFDAEELLLFRVDPRLSGYRGSEIRDLYDRLAELLEAVPGVRAVTLSRHPLLAGSAERTGDGVFVLGPGSEIQQGVSYLHRVRWNFFAAMDMPIVSGRGLAETDNERAPLVAVVNEAFARSYFGSTDPVGYRFAIGSPTAEPFEIVGVAGDAKYTGQRDPVPATLYVAHGQAGPSQMSFAVRSAGDPTALVSAVRAAIREVDPNLPIFELTTQADLASRRLSVERRLASLSSGAGLLALFLTCLALYGTLSSQVARRTREIGIRMALGAPRHGVVSSVVREVLVLVSLGLIAGLPVAHLSARLVSDQLYTVEATSIGVRLVAMAAMLAIAAAAAYLPARRASQVDPVMALGAE